MKARKRERADLGKAALTASGLTPRELRDYLAKIDLLCQSIRAEAPPGGSDAQKAEALFDWLWQTKPQRYEYRGPFQLREVLDAQLSPTLGKVGNCLGLTLLYNVLAQRLGLRVGAGHLEEAFGRGPHVFSMLYTEGGIIDIENIFPHGFDYPGHRDNPLREEWGHRELVADLYHSRGNHFFEGGDLEKAIESYSKAIKMNPRYTKAYLNKGLALCELGREEEARRVLERAGSGG